MKLYISTDDNGDIHICDDNKFTPDFPVRFNEMDFPNTGRKRNIIINLKDNLSGSFPDKETDRFDNA